MVGEFLTPREQSVLAALVRVHVDLGSPVGSAGLLERESLEVSPATIRKALVSLEEKGFLRQPHTSAGRLPTNKAYRYYATHALEGRDLTHIGLLRRQLEAKLQQLSADEIHGQLAEIIGDLSMQLGLVLAPTFEQVRLQRLELVRLAEGRLLLVAVLETGPVHSLAIEVGSSVDPGEVVGVSTRLNERLAGLTLAQVRETVRERIGPMARGQQDLLRLVIDRIERMTSPAGPSLHVAGARHICAQPEFRDSLNVAELLDLVEHRHELAGLLSDREGVVVTIGEEHDPEGLRLCGLVTASYEVHGAVGVIGVMGPARMAYDRVMALVNYTASRAPELVS